MNRAFVMKSSLVLGLMSLCLAQGCPSGTQTAGHVPDETSNGDDTTPGGGGDVTGAITIEPDDYADGTVLTDVNAAFTLSTALDDNEIAELFEVTATVDGMDHAPTGDQVFAHHNIPFFNDVRRLRVDFDGIAQTVQLTFAAGSFFTPEIGVLQAYDAFDNLVDEYVTQPLVDGETELMTVSGAIAWTVAYSQGSSFGRLDRLVVNLGGN